jgi:hypothetical protein
MGGEVVYSVYGQSGAVLYRDNVTTGVATDYLRLGGVTFLSAFSLREPVPTSLENAWHARIKGSATSYLHADHLGSPAAATDGTGAKLWRED